MEHFGPLFGFVIIPQNVWVAEFPLYDVWYAASHSLLLVLIFKELIYNIEGQIYK